MTLSLYYQRRLNLANALLKAGIWLNGRYGLKALPMTDRYQSAMTAISTLNLEKDALRERIIALIGLYALWAYEQGFISSGADITQLTEANSANVAAFVAEQSDFADGLAEAIVENRVIQSAPIGSIVAVSSQGSAVIAPSDSGVPGTTVTDAVRSSTAAALDTRLGMWKDTLGTIQGKGRSDGAKQGGVDIMVTFHLGPTHEHCKSANGMIGCEDLDNQRHPFSWFEERGYLPRVPANPNITCHGWNCLCFLSDDIGNVIY